MNNPRHRIQHLDKLLRLQRSRIAAAEAAYRVSQTEYDKINAAMQQRQARIDHMRQQRNGLIDDGVERDSSEFVRFSDYASARKKWLDHDLERDEYWLKDDQQELRVAAARVGQMRGQWLQSRAREMAINNLLSDARRQKIRAAEAHMETEAIEIAATSSRNLR